MQTLRISLALALCFIARVASAESLTGGKDFWPWLWQDQIKPTASAAWSRDQALIAGGGTLATVLSHQYDGEVREQFGDNRRLEPTITQFGSIIGSGAPGALIAAAQLYFDRANGLRSVRAMAFTAATHFPTALIVQRERPNGYRLSFPSGHTSSIFATATSLAYSYGAWVGVPAIAVATFVGVSRIADNAHWLSDTVSGAALGIFWARASYRASAMADAPSGPGKSAWMPALIPGGAVLSYETAF